MAGQNCAMFGWSWTKASVLGSQAFGRALMEGCGLHKKIVKGPYRELEELPCTLFVQTYEGPQKLLYVLPKICSCLVVVISMKILYA